MRRAAGTAALQLLLLHASRPRLSATGDPASIGPSRCGRRHFAANAPGGGGGGGGAERCGDEAATTAAAVATGVRVTTVAAVDPFCRTRMLNVVRRLAAPSVSSGSAAPAFHMSEAADGALQVATLALPPLGSDTTAGGEARIAMGIARTAADAQCVCAMHAERVLDAFGEPIYTIKAMQDRHAAAARAAGRWAPLHGATERPLPERVVVPRPLMLIAAEGAAAAPGDEQLVAISALPPPRGDAAARERRAARPSVAASPSKPPPHPVGGAARGLAATATDAAAFTALAGKARRRVLMRLAGASASVARCADESEGGAWLLCNVVTNRCPNGLDEPMLTPAFIDPNSLLRVRRAWNLLASAGTAPPQLPAFDDAIIETVSRYDQHTFFECRLPIPMRWQQQHQQQRVAGAAPPAPIVARGKAQSRERALQLMGMHCELLFDHACIPIHPDNPERQRRHRETALCCRPAAVQGVAPLPLKELSPLHNEYFYMSLRTAPLGREEKFLRFHGEVYNNAKTIVQVSADGGGDPAAPAIVGFASTAEAEAALEAFQAAHRMRRRFFLVSEIGHGDFRCSCVLHNLDRPPVAPDDSDVDDERLIAGEETDAFPHGALGFGPTPELARILCVRHALELLARRHLPLFPFDPQRQAAYDAARRAAHLYAAAAPAQEPHAAIAPPPPPPPPPIPQEVRDVTECDVAEDATGFLPRLALSGPSLAHHPRRSAALPPHGEVAAVAALSSTRDFAPFADDAAGALVAVLQPLIRRFLTRTGQPEPRSAASGAATLRSLVQDEGTAGRHRSTAWRHLWLPAPNSDAQGRKTSCGASQEMVTCMGRGIRLKEADRLCHIHMGLVLAERGLLEVPPGRQTQELERLLSQCGRSITPFSPQQLLRFAAPQLPAYDDLVAPNGGAEFRFLTPPLVSQFFFRRQLQRRQRGGEERAPMP